MFTNDDNFLYNNLETSPIYCTDEAALNIFIDLANWCMAFLSPNAIAFC